MAQLNKNITLGEWIPLSGCVHPGRQGCDRGTPGKDSGQLAACAVASGIRGADS